MTDSKPKETAKGYEGHANNKWWLERSTHGRKPLFKNPEDLEDACNQYFEWADKHPLWENKVAQYQGTVIDMPVAKMRAMTISGMCLYIGMSTDTWKNYKKRDGFLEVTQTAEQVIYDQKFAGASADLLNANIIARDLGLANKTDHQSSDGSMSPRSFNDFYSKQDGNDSES